MDGELEPCVEDLPINSRTQVSSTSRTIPRTSPVIAAWSYVNSAHCGMLWHVWFGTIVSMAAHVTFRYDCAREYGVDGST